jgi:hypothetical protein
VCHRQFGPPASGLPWPSGNSDGYRRYGEWRTNAGCSSCETVPNSWQGRVESGCAACDAGTSLVNRPRGRPPVRVPGQRARPSFWYHPLLGLWYTTHPAMGVGCRREPPADWVLPLVREGHSGGLGAGVGGRQRAAGNTRGVSEGPGRCRLGPVMVGAEGACACDE